MHVPSVFNRREKCEMRQEQTEGLDGYTIAAWQFPTGLKAICEVRQEQEEVGTGQTHNSNMAIPSIAESNRPEQFHAAF
jgi:hypothetical protein